VHANEECARTVGGVDGLHAEDRPVSGPTGGRGSRALGLIREHGRTPGTRTGLTRAGPGTAGPRGRGGRPTTILERVTGFILARPAYAVPASGAFRSNIRRAVAAIASSTMAP